MAKPAMKWSLSPGSRQRLDGMTKYLVDVKRQLSDEEGHLGMLGLIVDTLAHHQATAQPGSARDPDG